MLECVLDMNLSILSTVIGVIRNFSSVGAFVFESGLVQKK